MYQFFLCLIVSFSIHILLLIWALNIVFVSGIYVERSVYPKLILEYKFFEKGYVAIDEKKNYFEKRKQVHNKKYQHNFSQFKDVASKKSSNTGLLSDIDKNLNRMNLEEKYSELNHPIRRIDPIYPNQARLLKVEGQVTVVYDINVGGKVENMRIVYSRPPGIFDNSVRLAMDSWIYEKQNPKNNLIVIFKFNLRGIKKSKK